MKVVIVYGGWRCTAGYVHWAYVSEAVEPTESSRGQRVDGIDCYEMSRIGGKLFQPANRMDIDDPKNCNYDKEPNPEPRPACEKWIKDNGHDLVAVVKMRTD